VGTGENSNTDGSATGVVGRPMNAVPPGPTRSRALDILWAIYAPIYDVLLVLKPYASTLTRVCHVLVRENAHVVMDAGCGTGNLALYAARQGISVWGVDSSPAMLAIARLKQRLWYRKLASSRFLQADLNTEVALAGQLFDAVVSIGVLHAVNDPERVLKGLTKHLKPNGVVVLVLPLPVSTVGIISEHIRTASVGRLVLSIFLLPLFAVSLAINLIEETWAAGGHLHFLTEEEVRALVEQSGLRIVECYPVFGNAYTFVFAARREEQHVT
jgi:2-polyprenyl-3-methyl-5-hydroxy-6-metoxy-1,4-benzoquinol methylase